MATGSGGDQYISMNHMDILIMSLLKLGADVNYRDMFGNSVIHIACRHFIEYGADDMEDHLDNFREFILFLIDQGAGISDVSNDNQTPLFDSLRNYVHDMYIKCQLGNKCKTLIIKILVQQNSDLTIAGDLSDNEDDQFSDLPFEVDWGNVTPMDLVLINGQLPEILCLLSV